MHNLKKLYVGILFGGMSPEHEISILSMKNIVYHIDKKKFNIIPIEINRKGTWNLYHIDDYLHNKNVKLNVIGQITSFFIDKNKRLCCKTLYTKIKIDIIFPIIHGVNGEDGSIQGFLQTLNIPYIGSNIVGSAVNFNKNITKCLLRDSGINVVPFILITKNSNHINLFKNIKRLLGKTLFIKPNSMGSSIGISRVTNEREFNKALSLAFNFDHYVLIEKAIECREIECGIIGNKNLNISSIGEVLHNNIFYTFYDKYNNNNIRIQVPAKLTKKIERKIICTAKKVFRILNCSDIARIDFFLTVEEELYVNEINTIPGFSRTSIFPKLWECSGISLRDLITNIIYLGYEKYKSNKKIVKI